MRSLCNLKTIRCIRLVGLSRRRSSECHHGQPVAEDIRSNGIPQQPGFQKHAASPSLPSQLFEAKYSVGRSTEALNQRGADDDPSVHETLASFAP